MRQAFHRKNIKHGNIIRQVFIEPEYQVIIPSVIYVYMKKELTGMNPRICPATANNGYVGFKNLTQQCFEDNLYTVGLRQFLPTLVLKTVITDMKEVAQAIKVRNCLCLNSVGCKTLFPCAFFANSLIMNIFAV